MSWQLVRFTLGLCLVLLLATSATKPPVTTIYLVRHAEKFPAAGLLDPGITPVGEARAQLLAERLARRKPASLFTTDTRRSRATLAPLAAATGLTPLVYDAKNPDALAIQIYKEYAGRTVVVVGHSDTLLPLLAALGIRSPVQEIKDNEYDYLFRVELRPGELARLKVEHYGAPPVPAPGATALPAIQP